jgi:tryptophan-rich hypothetical protein
MPHPGQVLFPAHPDRLLESKWSRVGPGAHRHFWVSRVDREGSVYLSAVLDETFVEVFPWRELRDRDRWSPGWSVGCAQ